MATDMSTRQVSLFVKRDIEGEDRFALANIAYKLCLDTSTEKIFRTGKGQQSKLNEGNCFVVTEVGCRA